MLLNKIQQELKEAVEALIDAGCNYRLDDLERLYAPELTIVMLLPDGSVLNFDYQQNMEFFRQLRDSGAPPIDKTAEYNYIDVRDQFGYVIVTRQMDLGEGSKKIVFNLMLNKSNGVWQIYREQAVVISET
ncbi:hypothetical protein [Marinomonas posidonica]|uniref:DUF4440 domain-containing protein n=1 Tax=Marinomonas posidonica (strain CECT 7376 / NCIMB 14433 / IVIA-Po-181) TaxID=491952 RepID=F6CTU2_MARPP|nr:hypothetical protein [Marinomonas posidonica]AEF56311.1 hypothetical protein Mar181_3291 [Marinomonas posidonica IVIA-Po-181]